MKTMLERADAAFWTEAALRLSRFRGGKSTNGTSTMKTMLERADAAFWTEAALREDAGANTDRLQEFRKKADKDTGAADKATKAGGHGEAAKAHRAAFESHVKAASQAQEDGRPGLVRKHAMQADEHERTARAHEQLDNGEDCPESSK